MKKISLLLVLVLLASTLAACGGGSGSGGSSSTPAGGDSSGSGEALPAGETTFGLTPLAERQTLRVGFFAGSALSIPFYIADQEGFFDELNIDVKYETFTGGPAMMEANSDWDVAGAGSAGIINGIVGYDIYVIGVSDYEWNQTLFVRPDSPIAQNPDDPEAWRGTEWLVPVGTTAYFTLLTKLETMGLSDADIKVSNLAVANALTAYDGGEGDGLAVWNAFAFNAEGRGYVRITDAGEMGVTNPSCTVATKDALDNKAELVAYAWAVFYKTSEWMNESEENKQKAIDYYFESCLDEGVDVDDNIARLTIEAFAFPTVEEGYRLMTETAPDAKGIYTERDLLALEQDLLVPMDFFIAFGNYTEQNRADILDNHKFDASAAEAGYALLQ